jgi:hypothetical protein
LEQKTLQQALDDYLETRRTLKALTITDMRKSLAQFCPDWLQTPITKITPVMVEKRHKTYSENHSKARANLGCRYLRAVFNYAVAKYKDNEDKPLVGSNPVKRLSETRKLTIVNPFR